MLIGVSSKTLKRWDEKKILEAKKDENKHRYYTYDQYIEYMKNTQTASKGTAGIETHEAHYKPSEFARMIGVCNNTLIRWDKEKKLIADRTPTNIKIYTDRHLEQAKELLKTKADPKAFEVVPDAPKSVIGMNDEVTIGKVADFYGVSVKTVRRWSRNGKKDAKRDDINRRIYKVSDIATSEDELNMEKISRKDAAGIIGISISTICRWEKNGLINAYRTPAGGVSYPMYQVMYLAQKKAAERIKAAEKKDRKKRIARRIA